MDRLEKLRDAFSWATPAAETVLVRGPDGAQNWWTFAGMAANSWLAIGLGDLTDQSSPSDLSIRLRHTVDPSDLLDHLERLVPEQLALSDHLAEGAVDRLKFAEALPDEMAKRVVERRMRADAVVRTIANRPVRVVVSSQ